MDARVGTVVDARGGTTPLQRSSSRQSGSMEKQMTETYNKILSLQLTTPYQCQH